MRPSRAARGRQATTMARLVRPSSASPRAALLAAHARRRPRCGLRATAGPAFDPAPPTARPLRRRPTRPRPPPRRRPRPRSRPAAGPARRGPQRVGQHRHRQPHLGGLRAGGLATATRAIWWVHNDGPNSAQPVPASVYALDTRGKITATLDLTGATNVDWEDIDAVTIGGTDYLWVADVGDNSKVRPNVQLYRVAEPVAHHERARSSRPPRTSSPSTTRAGRSTTSRPRSSTRPTATSTW